MPSILEMNEAEWNEQKNEYKRRMGTIILPLDISPSAARGLLARIDSFFSEVRLELGEIEGKKEGVENIIREWERTKIQGQNELSRKKAASEAIQSYPLGEGQTVNLYELQRDLAERVSYMYGIIQILDGKQSRLITTTGLLKIDKELAPYSDTSWDGNRRS